MTELKTACAGRKRDEWAVHDEIDDALRLYLGGEIPYRIDVWDQGDRLSAKVTLNAPAPPALRTIASTLESRLAAEGDVVEIDFKEGKVPPHSPPRMQEARAEFERIWKHLEGAASISRLPTGKSHSPVRDFIYLDLHLLASLFAQSQKGLTTLIHRQEKGSQGAAEGRSGKGDVFSFDVERFQGEMAVLHDHMYRLVEIDLASSMTTVVKGGPPTALEQFQQNRICRVSGPAEVFDYERMTLLINKFNELGEAVACATLQAPEFREKLALAQKEYERLPGNKKATAKEKVKALSDPKQFAIQHGLHQDEKFLAALTLFADLFIRQGYEVRISTTADEAQPVFKAYLNRDFLRTPPERLRLLYGSPTQAEWTLVGSVTSVSGPEDKAQLASDLVLGSHDPKKPGPALGAAFGKLIQAIGVIEDLFRRSTPRPEVVIQPLAIYRDLRE